MISATPLTEQQQKKSQFNYNCFNAMNGTSYMCLGETVMILLAIKMNSSEFTVSALGAMLYAGYLLLPLGKIAAAKYGGAYSQSLFWICRNIAALMVAASGVCFYFNWHAASVALILTGAFFFYGFRAAGVVMSQPLVGEITDEKSRGRFISFTNGIFFCSRLVTLLAITYITTKNDSLWTLVGIIIFGACCGISSSKFMRNITETTAIRDSARKPLAPEIRWGLKNITMRRQLYAGFTLNFILLMTVPISILAVKRGYGVSDSDALVFTIAQTLGASVFGFVSSKLVKYIGPRKEMIAVMLICLFGCFSWQILPEQVPYGFMLFYFFMLGAVIVWNMGSPVNYFLQTIAPEHRVGGSVLLAVVTGAPSGIATVIVSGSLLEIVSKYASTPLEGYRIYFLIAGLIGVPGILVVKGLIPLDVDKRGVFSKAILPRISRFITRRH